MEKPRPLLYNLHRLIVRCASPTPTGIDRVDFQHARFLLELAKKEGRIIQFIRQQGSVAFPVSHSLAQTIIHNLEQRWQQGKAVEPAVRFGITDIIKRWPVSVWQKKRNILIRPEIRQNLEITSKPPIYLHSGHGTLQHVSLHQQIKKNLQADSIYYLHDLIPINFPEYTNRPHELASHRQRIQTMVTTGSLILANSTDSKQNFIDYCQQNDLPAPKIETLFIGVEEHILAAAQQATLGLPQLHQKLAQSPYFISIGTIEPRKNHILLLHLWRQMAQEQGTACPKLIILGKRGWKNDNLIHLLDRSPALRDHVIEINDATDNDMIALLQHSRALLFPSFAEGWGMPLAEALTLGTPAICADIPALRECGRHHATYLDPLDGPGWKRAILHHINSIEPRQLATGYRADLWQNHLEKLKNHIHRLDQLI